MNTSVHTVTESTVHEFLGWLMGDIPELRHVEASRLLASWEAYKRESVTDESQLAGGSHVD